MVRPTVYCHSHYHKSFERAGRTHPIISRAWQGSDHLAAADAHL